MSDVIQTQGHHGGALREDVADIIFDISPDETPFYNDIGDGTAGNPHHQWTTRSLTLRQHNAVPEGDAFAGNYSAVNVPSRVTNICQIFRKLPQVARSMQSSTTVGISDLMADQISLRMVEIKTDMEHTFLRGSVVTGASVASTAVARQLGGFLNVISSNSFDYNSTGTFTETMFVNLLEQVWTDGGNPKKVLVGSAVKRTIGTFVASSTKFLEARDREVTNVVNVYESDFGVTNIRISRDIPNSAAPLHNVIAYDPDFFKKAWLDAPFVEKVPKVGDSMEAAILAEGTLEYGNEAAGGALLNIGTLGA